MLLASSLKQTAVDKKLLAVPSLFQDGTQYHESKSWKAKDTSSNDSLCLSLFLRIMFILDRLMYTVFPAALR